MANQITQVIGYKDSYGNIFDTPAKAKHSQIVLLLKEKWKTKYPSELLEMKAKDAINTMIELHDQIHEILTQDANNADL